MKSQIYNMVRYDADEGKVFDWVNLENHTYVNEDGETVQEHLYAKTLFIGDNDSIDNYVEVDEEINE